MATEAATKKYFEKFSGKGFSMNAIREFGDTGWQVSPIGFGGYRVHYSSDEHAKALIHALMNGVNLIDTSSNYSDGGSETLVGIVLEELEKQQRISRDEVILVSKAGYVQGANLELAKKREKKGNPFPEMVKYAEKCWHCIHPEFLEDQLKCSLLRLKTESLDVFLLHNPEYFLFDTVKKEENNLPGVREEYYRRISDAFQWMEEKVSDGLIKSYGISSNTFTLPGDDLRFTSLERVMDIAGSIGKSSHFRVIQFPFNIYETGAFFEKNQANGSRTLLEIAAEKQLAVMVNRPLNASTDNGIVRLASFRETDPEEIKNRFAGLMDEIAVLEAEFKKNFLPKAPIEVAGENLERTFSLSEYFSDALSSFKNRAQWDHISQSLLLPQTRSYLKYLSQVLKDDDAWNVWSEKYSKCFYSLLDTVSKQYENEAQVFSNKLCEFLDHLTPDLKSSSTLSQKSLRILNSVPGIHCVLLGMRRKQYVMDAVTTFVEEPVGDIEAVLEKLKVLSEKD